MSKIYKILTFNILLVFTVLLMSACGGSELFTISFNSNGGTEIASIVTNGKSVITMPENPTKEGFTFDGWFFNDGIFTEPLTTNSLLDEPISSNITVYANWIEDEEVPVYTITVNPNFLDAEVFLVQTEDGYVESINTPVRAGYEFNGWWLSTNGGLTLTSQWNSLLQVYSDLVLYADWVEESTSQGQLQAPAVSVLENEISWQEIAQATGYDVIFSYKNNNQSIEYSSEFTTNNYFEFSIYDANIYTVKVRAKGNGVTSANSVFTTRTIYHKVLSSPVNFAFDYNTNALTWLEVENAHYYEVEYRTNTTSTYTFVDIYYTNTYIIPETLNPNAYHFKVTAMSLDNYIGSYGTYTLNYVKLAIPTGVIIDKETARISWTSVLGANLYNLQIGEEQFTTTNNYYDLNLTPSQSLDFKIRAFDVNTDYLASNWTSVITVKKIATPVISFTNGVLSWDAIDEASYYFVSIDDVIEYNYLSETSININFVKTGEISIEVRALNNSNNLIHSDYSNPIHLTVHLVNFMNIDDQQNSLQYIYDGGKAIAPQLEKIGYEFVGWYTDTDFLTEWNSEDAITSSIELYAKWQISQYTISFNSNGGSLVNSITKNYNETVVAPTNVFKENFVLSGWFTKDDGIKPFTFNKMPNRNLTVFASWYTEGLSFSTVTGGYLVSKGVATANNVILPEVYNNLPVLQVGSFSNYTELYSITIPDTIIAISGTFSDCVNLTTVNISSTSKLQSIGYGAFYNCSNLRTIVLPETVTYIGSNAFSYCSALTTFVVNSINPPTIGNDVFIGYSYGGFNYTSSSLWNLSIYVPSASLDIYKVADKWSLYSNKITASNITLDSDGFVIDGDKLIQYIGNSSSIIIPENVLIIGEHAFYNNQSLSKIDMLDSLQIIEENAVKNCSNLSEINIGAGVTIIETKAIYDCPKLSLIYLSRAIDIGITTCDINSINEIASGMLIFVPSDSVEAYKTANGWSRWQHSIFSKDIIDQNGFAINENVLIKYFNKNNNNEEIIVPANITSIRGYAFANLANNISFAGTSITTITHSAFKDYIGQNIILPNNLQTIESEAFVGCINLNSISIPASVTSVSYTSFKNTGIWNNANNNSVVYADNWLVGYKGTITNINIPSNIIGIAHYALSGCLTLTNATFSPNSQLKYFGVNAFAYTAVSEINIPASVELIGSYAFRGCTNLIAIYLEKSSSEGMIAGANNMFYNHSPDFKIYVADEESLLAYKAAEYWSSYANRIFIKP